VKSNPDSPQWPVRQRALADGIVVYMAVPRLAQTDPFFLLDPLRLDVSPRKASSIKGAGQHGRTVPVEALQPVDLVVTGCVAVDRTGARLADLEFAIASAAGLIGPDTLVATTVHPVQVLDPGRIPVAPHDAPIDLIVTPDEVIRCDGGRDRPAGIVWDALTDEKIAAIPLLGQLAQERR
jgi:5-formyltetrahydrofolate cyclo-ligase